MIIAIEGIDGSGKSTLAQELAAHIPNAIAIRELSSTTLGRAVSGWVSEHDITKDRDIAKEALKRIHAARISALHQLVLPHIIKGGLVIYDRFALTTAVYRAFKPEWDLNGYIQRLFAEIVSIPEIRVQATVLLSVSPEKAHSRIGRRDASQTDINDQKGISYLSELSERYFQAVREVPSELIGSLMLVDADKKQDEVLAATMRELQQIGIVCYNHI